jgi:hypothetical protein
MAGRVLHFVERRVPALDRAAYAARLAMLRDSAALVHGHVWAFAHCDDDERVVEFVEAPSDVALSEIVPGAPDVWRELTVV